MAPPPAPPAPVDNPFADFLDLASSRLGGFALASNDDFFAERDNLLKPEPAHFAVDAYTERGKWMDGWESRRNRTPDKDHDWVVIRLGLPGEVLGVDVDTSYFVGNAPEEVEVQALTWDKALRPHEVAAIPEGSWQTIVGRRKVERGAHNMLYASGSGRVTHLRLKIFPDGGVARFRAYGRVLPDWDSVLPGQLVDLASVAWGGKALACNDAFFSSRDNINLPWSSRRMDDGWETRRRRSYNASGAGGDWIIVALGKEAEVREAVLETHHFKGNPPDSARLEAIHLPGAELSDLLEKPWDVLLPDVPLEPHWTHRFSRELKAIGPVSHVRLVIQPDGGVSRLRLFCDLGDRA